MECPKCHTQVDDKQTVCPNCKKVLALECPNCHSIGTSPVCGTCGYNILVKCSKCSKINSVTAKVCSKCKFPISTSLAYEECESDDFAAIIVKIGSLNSIRKKLGSQDMYVKFFNKIKNVLFAQIKGFECKLVNYNNIFVINMNKELSLSTSSNKAVRLALKIINAFVDLNVKVNEQFLFPLDLSLTIVKKDSEHLLDLPKYNCNVKTLSVKKNDKKYLKGLQVILDQFVCDEVNKEYKTDSLYTMESDGKSIMFYEIILDSYILPPEEKKGDDKTFQAAYKEIKKSLPEENEKDMFSFKVFDINAKCAFERHSTSEILDRIKTISFETGGKIVSIRSGKKNSISSQDLRKVFEKRGLQILSVSCTEEMNYKPWGFFEVLFKECYKMSFHNRFNDISKLNAQTGGNFSEIFQFLMQQPVKAMSPEDARFAYMEHWGKFLASLSNTIIIVENFPKLDDTSIQTLELYFDKFNKIKPNFIFTTSNQCPVHSKIKGLLRTPCYVEFTLNKSTIDSCLATLKLDATDFIQSFYFEKIKENFKGSYLYFKNAINYLKDTGVLIEFENKFIVKDKKAVILPVDLKGLFKSRIKALSGNMEVSLILAYSTILGGRIDIKTLEALGIKDIQKNAKFLDEVGLALLDSEILYINNFNIVSEVITSSLKPEIETFLAKNIVAQLGKGLDNTTLSIAMGKLKTFKEEYLTLWKNSQFAINTGDYDAYLKNCLGFLSLVEHIEANIEAEVLEENKKDVYNNILMFLYGYSPAKIYFIENLLLMDAINQGDDEKIVKLSNLMLQGALISSNYTDALKLLHNILSRMPEPTLLVQGAVNTKFLLLSLVHIEILYNVGHYRECVELAEDILNILSPEVLEKVKPASFSTNLFVSHVMDTLRLVGFAKLYLMDNNIEDFFTKIKSSLNDDLPEKDCILAIKDFFAGKVYSHGNIEEYSPFAKAIFLILQEFSALKDDYKAFAQNIYQAKLLAVDIHQREIELFCDLLIGYAYSKIGITEKSETIYKDVLSIAQQSAIFNIIALANYFIAKLNFEKPDIETALLAVNDSLAMIRKQDNGAVILYAIFEKLYIEIAKQHLSGSVDIESEVKKLIPIKEELKLILADIEIKDIVNSSTEENTEDDVISGSVE